jgi:hypothetical protein
MSASGAGSAPTCLCPRCGTTLRVPVPAGHAFECSACGALMRLRIPASQETAKKAPEVTLPASGSITPTPPTDERQPIPGFNALGALVRCPECHGIHQVDRDDYSRPVDCACGCCFRVLVGHLNTTQVRCPCGCVMQVALRHSGGKVPCPACAQPIQVPRVPIVVERLEAREIERHANLVRENARVQRTLESKLARRCIRCGKRLRNPSSFCTQCRP